MPAASPTVWKFAAAAVLFCSAFTAALAWVAPRPPAGPPDSLVAAPKPADDKVTYERHVAPLIGKYCLNCHSSAKKRGGIILDREGDDAAVLKNRALWEKVGDNLREGVMPPEGAKKPTAAEMETINKWLDAVVFKLDCTGPKDPGRVTIRRLNRAEYNNTVRDLLGVDFQPGKDFPADDVGHGFDNIGDVLSLSPILMEKYLAAAGKIVEQAWADPAFRKRLMPRPFRERDAMANNLRAFANRAWRRPATADEVKRLLDLGRVARDAGEPPDVGMRLMLQAVLVSPHFLFRIEQDREKTELISEWELATRLSYFLWSSMPDDDLFKLAEEGKLRQPGVIEAQVKRMLASPKAVALADNFAMQWLNLRTLATFSPDPKRFPTFNAELRQAMLEETRRFFLHVARNDVSVLDFLNADYSFLNDVLAKHYGIEGVKGKEFRRLSLKGTPRAGVLTHASVLSVTSNPTRTSPVKRGKWVLENVLGTPPPPPPPDVPELKEEGELRGSLREQMEQHRKDPGCASCHARMDPLGFGYENFDAVGRWRTHDGKHRVDPSGVLPDGSKFDGPAGLRTVLMAKKDQFVRCLTDKLLTYALGRGTTRSDRCFIEEMAKNLAKDDYKFTRLVVEIVKSDPFQKRRAKGAPR